MFNENRREDIIYLIRYLQKLIDKDFDKRLSEHDLTGKQGRILFYTASQNRMGNIVHQNDVEREFHLSKSTVSGIVRRMEKRGIILVEKKPPYVELKPTDYGLSIIDHLRLSRNESEKMLINGFSKEETKDMCEHIIKLIKNMEGDE